MYFDKFMVKKIYIYIKTLFKFIFRHNFIGIHGIDNF